MMQGCEKPIQQLPVAEKKQNKKLTPQAAVAASCPPALTWQQNAWEGVKPENWFRQATEDVATFTHSIKQLLPMYTIELSLSC